VGVAVVLISATAFGTNAIFGKLGYQAGLGTSQTLAFRFVLGAAGMWALAIALRQDPLRLPRRQLLTLLALGAIFYTAQSLSYFTALRTLPASVCVLIAYLYPSQVVIAGWLFLRRRISLWQLVALIGSFTGVLLLVGGAQLQVGWGLVFAIAAPTIYTGYILVGESVMNDVPAVGASAVIISGAGIAFTIIAAIQGELALPASAGGWAVAFGVALIPTMIAISTFLAGLPRIGAARASLISTWEPVVTIALAAVLFSERFTVPQLLGGVLILVAVILQAGREAGTGSNAAAARN
jgi:drug/metabolite transporter (DMT)-like permease